MRTAPAKRETFCLCCPHPVSMISATAAAAQVGVDVSAIYSEVARQTVHFAETADGLLLICSDSLDERFRQKEHSSVFVPNVARTE